MTKKAQTIAPIHFNDENWTYLGKGTYNLVYRSPDQKFVLKIPQRSSEVAPSDTPSRAVRLWNLVNPDFATAKVVNTESGQGWICPYIEGIQASEEEIHLALIDLYNTVGRIVLDAFSPKNFLKMDNGTIICVDVGYAFFLPAQDALDDETRSLCSENVFNQMEGKFNTYFKEHETGYSKSIKTIQALLFIAKNRSNIKQLDFLKHNHKLIQIIADAYKEQYNKAIITPNITTALDRLNKQQPLELNQIKAYCNWLLHEYILSRGKINQSGFFESSATTKMFRNESLTKQKATTIYQLIQTIEDAETIDEIQQLLQDTLKDPHLTQAKFRSGLARYLTDCLDVLSYVVNRNVNIIKNEDEDEDEDSERINETVIQLL